MKSHLPPLRMTPDHHTVWHTHEGVCRQVTENVLCADHLLRPPPVMTCTQTQITPLIMYVLLSVHDSVQPLNVHIAMYATYVPCTPGGRVAHTTNISTVGGNDAWTFWYISSALSLGYFGGRCIPYCPNITSDQCFQGCCIPNKSHGMQSRFVFTD